MKSKNPTIKKTYLKTLQSASISLKISNVFTTNNGTVLFSTPSMDVKYRKVFLLASNQMITQSNQ